MTKEVRWTCPKCPGTDIIHTRDSIGGHARAKHGGISWEDFYVRYVKPLKSADTRKSSATPEVPKNSHPNQMKRKASLLPEYLLNENQLL